MAENAKSAEERPEGKREAGIGQHAAIFSIEALYVMLRGEARIGGGAREEAFILSSVPWYIM